MHRVLFASMVFTLLLGACGGDREPQAEETGTPIPVETPTEEVTPTRRPTPTEASCPDADAAVTDDSARQPGRLAGDLEEDGIRDVVSLSVDRAGEEGCQAFVVAESDGDVRSVPIAVPDIPFSLGFPRLISMPLIDDRPGAEIVVGVAAGASTQFAAIYTVDDGGQLVQVVREGVVDPRENLLAFGGSVGHQDAFDCAPEKGEGVVVVSEATPTGEGARFEYTRRFFVPRAPALYAEDPSLEEEGSVRFNRFETLHEFPNAPFGSCPTGEIAG
jgi:hypothetical protein